MSHSAVAVFTGRKLETIIAQGGSQAWVLDPQRARSSKFLVCVQNRNTSWGDGDREHGTAFMVGRISGVIASPEDGGRWMIRFSEYAEVDYPGTWGGWRNPVRYTTLEDLAIDFDDLEFEPMPDVSPSGFVDEGVLESPSDDENPLPPLTIPEAKRRLAATLGVSPESIKIIVEA